MFGISGLDDTIDTFVSYMYWFEQYNNRQIDLDEQNRVVAFMGRHAIIQTQQFLSDYLLLNLTSRGLFNNF